MDLPALPEARVVVGLDFGTTFSGFAYAHRSAPDDIFTHFEWPMYERGGGKPYVKTLTGVYYERQASDGTLSFHSWGWPAKVAYSNALREWLLAKKKGDADLPVVGEMITKFKLHLASEQEGPPSTPTMMELPSGLTPEQLIVDYLRGIGEFIVDQLHVRYGNQLTKEAIQWCLTVPSIWNDKAKQQMKLCMEKSGLVNGIGSSRYSENRGSPYPVIVVLEPEAASMYCHKFIASDMNLRTGDKFLVVDIGGGTTDIVVQARANNTGALKVREVSRSSGGLCGGTFVDVNFMEFLRRKIGCLSEFLDEFPDHELKFLGWWELAKSTFDGMPDFRITCPLSANLTRTWTEYDASVASDEVEISCEEMKTIFDPVVQQNIDLIEAQLSKAPDIKLIMVVGGFSGSPYMISKIKESFASRVSEIISPPHPGSAVCQGAVALALHADTILSRVARKTYGIGTSCRFEPGLDRVELREVVNGVAKCKNRFDVFVTRGDQVDTDHSVNKTYIPTYNGQKSMNISLYSTDDLEPRYTEGSAETVTKEGTFLVDMSDGADDLDKERKVQVTMYFGRSTIEVKAKALNFGDLSKVHEMLPVTFQGDLE